MKNSYLMLGLLLLSACVSSPTTHIDYDKSHSFSGYKSFSWAHLPPLIRTGDLPVSNALEDRATKTITRELESKGMQLIEETIAADFLVAYTIGARENADIYQQEAGVYENKDNWLWGREYHSYYFDKVLSEDMTIGYTRGVISIDIFDNKTKAPVWHGKASKSLSEAEISSDGGSIEEAISAILANFPP